MTRAASALIGLLLCSTVLFADDRSVTFDAKTDFSSLKTFIVRETRVESSRPELTNQLFADELAMTIRSGLTKKKLTETADRPDIVVDCRVTGIDYSMGPFRVARPIVPGRGRGAGEGPPVAFTQATLVIDLRASGTNALLWRGVYRDPKDSAPKLAKKIPDALKKMLSDYPPRNKK